MAVSERSSKGLFAEEAVEDSDYINVLNHYEELDLKGYSYESDHLSDNFHNLSKSEYAKVIFCDLYYNSDSTVGCRFQITDHVHEDPCDYIGLVRVGYENLSQCLASKMLSHTDCEDDGKLLRCTFKPSELPELESGFYQFLYVTRDSEVCGASTPFRIKNSITKGLCSDEDIVAENTEDDFLVVRSNMAERNRRLQALLDEMTEKCLKHESEMRKIHEKLKIVSEEKSKIEHLLKQACDEKIALQNEAMKVNDEKNIACQQKEEAVCILREKNRVFAAMFDDYSEKLKEFTELKDELLGEKACALDENKKLQACIMKLNEDLASKENALIFEQNKKQELASCWKNESAVLMSKLDDAKLMIEALEKNKQLSMNEIATLNNKVAILEDQLKDTKCKNLVLKTQLTETVLGREKDKMDMENMMSEVAALKLHIIELHESKSISNISSMESVSASGSFEILEEKNTSKENEDLQNLKSQCAELSSELQKKNTTILELEDKITKLNNEVKHWENEKEFFQKNGIVMQDALNECILRLNEGSELYKKQFRKIEKLKKKLKNDKTDFMNKISANTSVKDSCSSAVESSDETITAVPVMKQPLAVPQTQNSDSDTGEHVLRRPVNIDKKESSELFKINETVCQIPSLNAFCIPAIVIPTISATENEPIYPKVKEVPGLQTLIEMNLEKFKNSQSKEEEIQYSIPCPICDQDIGVYMSSTDEMVKHLEMQHKQQICPVCGRIFDMTLPPKYFLFHVEDHFKKENKK